MRSRRLQDHAQVELDLAPGGEPDENQAATLGHAVERRREPLSRHQVEHEIDALAAGHLAHPLRVVGVERHEMLDAEVAQALQAFGGARGGDDLAAELADQLHREGADARGRAGDEHRLAGAQLAPRRRDSSRRSGRPRESPPPLRA